MKQIILAFALVGLLSAGCTASQKQSTQNTTAQSTQKETTKTFSNTTFGYQFDAPSNYVLVSPSDSSATIPLTDANIENVNSVYIGLPDGTQIVRIVAITNQDEAAGLFSSQKLDDDSVWAKPFPVTFNGISYSKYIPKRGSYENTVEAYYYVAAPGSVPGALYIAVLNKEAGMKILNSLSLLK